MAKAIPRLGLFSVVAVGVNTIVGSGIFRLPAELAHDLGPASLVAFAVGALLCAAVALAFAEAGGMFERGGGAYVYARAAFGPQVGFAVGWSAWVATVLTLATVAVAVPGQLAELWPAAGGPVAAKAIAVVLIVALGAVNLIGLGPAAFATNAFALAKVVPLVLFVAVGVFFVDWGNLAPLAPHGWGRTGPALLVVFFALSGFEAAAVPAGEAARARRDVPLAVVGSVLGAAVLYVLIQVVALGVLPDLGASERPLADAGRVFLGAAGARAIAVLGAVSMVGLCAAMALCGPRFLVALAEDGFLPAGLARHHPRRHTPLAAVVVSTAAAAAYALLFDFRRLVDATSVMVILQYLSTCVAVPVLRRTRPDLPRTVRLPLGPVIPAVGALLLLGVLSQVGRVDLELTAATVLAGVVLAAAWRAARPARAA